MLRIFDVQPAPLRSRLARKLPMLDNWQERFPDCEPVSHLLRVAFRERWVRFHSLAESKRYPETESEYETVLHRHNRILGELVTAERRVVLLTAGYSETTPPVRNLRFGALDPDGIHWHTVTLHELESDFDNPNYWHVFASGWEWQPGSFDPIVRLIADGALANVMIVSPDCRWLLHPYDGGMDVIAESPAERDRLRAAHQDWLSAHPDGL